MPYAFENQVTRLILAQYGLGHVLERPESMTATTIEDDRLSSLQYTEDQFVGAWARFAMAEHDVNISPALWNNVIVPISGFDRLRGVLTLGRPVPVDSLALVLEVWQRANPGDIRRMIYDAAMLDIRVPYVIPVYDAFVPAPWMMREHTDVVFDALDYRFEDASYTFYLMDGLGWFLFTAPQEVYYASQLLLLRPGEYVWIGYEVAEGTAPVPGGLRVGLFDLDAGVTVASVDVDPVPGFHMVQLQNGDTPLRASVSFRVASGSVTVANIGMRRSESRAGVIPPVAQHADYVTAVGMLRGPVYGSYVYETGPIASEIMWVGEYGTNTIRFGEAPRGIPFARVLMPPKVYGMTADLSSMNTQPVVYEAPAPVLAAAAARLLLRRVELDYAGVQGQSAWLQAAKLYAEQQLARWKQGLIMSERSQTRVDAGNFAAPLGGYVDSYVYDR